MFGLRHLLRRLVSPYPLLLLLMPLEATGLGAGPAGRPEFHLRLIASDPAGGGDSHLSPDGRFFVTSSKRSGHWNLWIHNLESGQWTALTDHAADDFEAQFSPEGTRLVFTSTRGGSKDIWTMSLADRSLRRITTQAGEEEYPSWSPDGKTIVYTGGPWTRRNFYLISAEGGPARQLLPQPGYAGACSFFPDGRSLICHSFDGGTGDIFTLPIDGGQARFLTKDSSWDYKPTVSPRGKWAAFSRSQEGPSSIWLWPLGPGPGQALTTGPHDDRWPTWDAAGDKILFHRIVDSGTAIKVMNRSTGRVTTLVEARERPRQASFHPSARSIVFCAQTETGSVLRLKDLAGGAVRTLDTGPREACFPRWSPDGRRIAFVAKFGTKWQISTMAADGSGFKTWTDSAHDLRGMNGPLDWSPDSTRIVFHADTEPFEADLYLLDLRNGRIRNLTRDAWFDESPSWTPDGQGIVFMSTRGGEWTWGLFSLSLETGKVHLVTTPDYTEKNFPRPGSDGKTIWSMYDDKGIERLAEKAPEGETRVLEGAGAGARWPSYSSDGSLLLFTTVEHHIEYWLAERSVHPSGTVPQPNVSVKDDPAALKILSNGSLPGLLKTKAGSRAGGVPLILKNPIKLHNR